MEIKKCGAKLGYDSLEISIAEQYILFALHLCFFVIMCMIAGSFLCV
jgi:hypothetical protein